MSVTVPIKTETLKSFADEARRIGGTEDELSTDEMLDIFATALTTELTDAEGALF